MTPTDARPRRRPHGAVGLVAAALLLVGGAGVLGALSGDPDAPGAPRTTVGAAATATPTAPAPAAPAAPDVPRVAATPPPVDAASSPAGAPVRVVVPAHDVDMPVDPVGVAADGQMEIPPLAERGGWYRFGADPADGAGTTVIAGHVDSVASAGTGPFVRLPEVRAGDAVELTLADGTTRGYAVQSVTKVPKSEARWPDVFTREGEARLALITCGGAFDTATRHYTDNVLVIATPVGA